jgi:oxygen-dependent protoporphyrinogen oxidase
MTHRVAILGAGITGLSTHWFLEREARKSGIRLHVETWDPRERAGGNIATARREGWSCESAAESILNSRRETHDLAIELGLSDEIVQVSPAARKRYLLWKDKLRPLVPGPGLLFGSFPEWPARLGILRDLFAPRGPEDESVADFARRRLGAGLLEQVLDPVVTGIWAADPERLSIRSSMGALKDRETIHRSLLLGMLSGGRKSPTRSVEGPRGGSYTFRGGMAQLVERLASSLQGPVRTGLSVDSLRREHEGWTLSSGGTQERFDHVILALPAWQIAGLDGLPAELVTETSQLPYNPVAVVGLGFRREDVAHPLDGFGFLVPKRAERRILGTLFSSTLWPHAAPEGHVLVRTMVGGGRQPALASLPEEELVALVRSELADILGVKGEPVFRHLAIWPKGIPEYPVGHHDRVRRLRALLAGTGLHLAGNAWDGIGVNDCVAAALPRARALLEELQEGANQRRRQNLSRATD